MKEKKARTYKEDDSLAWRKVLVEEICEKVSVGIVVQPSQYYVTEAEGIRAFRSGNIGENNVIDADWVYLSKAGNESNAKSILQEGDVLVVRSGVPGTACVLPREFAGSNCIDIVFARPKKSDILPEYLAEVTNSPIGRRHVVGSQLGMALKHFNVGEYKKLEISLPSVQEQRKIIDFLNVWSSLVERYERLIQVKEGLYLAEIAKRIQFGGMKKSLIESFSREVSTRNNELQVARVLSVTNSNGFVLPEDRFGRRVASEDLSSYKIISRGQYAYNPSRINVGSIARLDDWDKGVLSPMYVVFELDEKKIDSDYFLHWLNSSETRARIRNSAQGSVRETVPFSALGALPIPLPKLAQQKAIARYLNSLRKEIRLLERKVELLKLQKRGLMQQLLTGKKRLNLTAAKRKGPRP
ncbi:MAG: restriction endonuclease subunit S [Lysobacteraceae bacterium]|nr:MAG: restriction endonuclease subunit S [Xanthomonadaceae bacterium]